MCNRKYSYVIGNYFMQDWTDLCKRICWKQFYASYEKTVQQEMSFIAANDFMRVWTDKCYRECYWVNYLLAGTPFLIFPPKLEQECAEPFYVVVTGDDSSHSQGQSGKRLLLASRGRKTIPSTIPKFLYWANLTPPPLGHTPPHPLPQILGYESSMINWFASKFTRILWNSSICWYRSICRYCLIFWSY